MFIWYSGKAKSGTNSRLQTIRKDNLSKLIFARLNINSIRNKFDSLTDVIKDNIDINIVNILVLSETKVDHSYPNGQSFLDGFGTALKYRNRNSGGIMLSIRNDVPAKVFFYRWQVYWITSGLSFQEYRFTII